MVCLIKQDLERLLKGMLVDLKDQLHDSSTKGKPSGKSTWSEIKGKILCYTCQQPSHMRINCSQRMDRVTDERQRGFMSKRPENQVPLNINAREFTPNGAQQLNCTRPAQ